MQRSPIAPRSLLMIVIATALASLTIAVQGQTGVTEAPAGESS